MEGWEPLCPLLWRERPWDNWRCHHLQKRKLSKSSWSHSKQLLCQQHPNSSITQRRNQQILVQNQRSPYLIGKILFQKRSCCFEVSLTISSWCLSISWTSSGSVSTREMVFFFPKASFSNQKLDLQGPWHWLLPNPHLLWLAVYGGLT